MITMTLLYAVAGLMFAGFALLSALDRSNRRRLANAAFWGLMAVSLLAGDWLGDVMNGLLVLALAAIGGFNLLGRGSSATTTPEQREGWSLKLGNLLFAPALIIPLVALAGTLLVAFTPVGQLGLFEPKRETYAFLVLGVLVALGTLYLWLRPPPLAPLQEGRRLVDSIGWALVLPQMLAALGAVFAAAGIGTLVGDAARAVVPPGSLFIACTIYALGMALFTMIMGNAFAAFPVMAAGIGVPLLIQQYGGSPAIVGAVGMLAGFCGTLMTPMAANFNLVPAALLDLQDRYGVVRAQVATALPLLLVNLLLIYGLAFR